MTSYFFSRSPPSASNNTNKSGWTKESNCGEYFWTKGKPLFYFSVTYARNIPNNEFAAAVNMDKMNFFSENFINMTFFTPDQSAGQNSSHRRVCSFIKKFQFQVDPICAAMAHSKKPKYEDQFIHGKGEVRHMPLSSARYVK